MLNSYMFNGSIPQMIVKVLDKDGEDYEFIGQCFIDLNAENVAKK